MIQINQKIQNSVVFIQQLSGNKIQTLSIITTQPFIGNIQHTPQYMRDVKLYSGYRINFNSYNQILKSLFQIHNQTVNIWTHFGGAIIMLIIILSVICYQYQIYNQSNQNKFELLLKQFDYQYNHCHFDFYKIINQNFIPTHLKQKVQSQICHPHGQEYFGDFVCQIAQKQINLIKNYMLLHFGENIKKLQKIILHWEKDVIPNIVYQVEKQSNSSIINYIRDKIQEIKVRMDQKQYQYLDFGQYKQNPSHVSRFPLIFFLLCAIVCLGCSSTFHLFNAMSSRAYKISIGLDYAGINVFIAGAVFPAFYYGMYCYFNVAYFYMTIIFIMGTSLFIISLFQWSRKPQNELIRSLLYASFSFFMTIPITHLIINQIFFDNYGDKFSFLPSLHWYILGAFTDILGLIVFTKRCPDRNNPGKYDVCGHSHQIWHTLILLGMFFLYFGACKNYQTRKQFTCPAIY